MEVCGFQESEMWKAKYDELKRQYDAQGDVAAQYAQLKAQYEALASVAVPPQEKCEVSNCLDIGTQLSACSMSIFPHLGIYLPLLPKFFYTPLYPYSAQSWLKTPFISFLCHFLLKTISAVGR